MGLRTCVGICDRVSASQHPNEVSSSSLMDARFLLQKASPCSEASNPSHLPLPPHLLFVPICRTIDTLVSSTTSGFESCFQIANPLRQSKIARRPLKSLMQRHPGHTKAPPRPSYTSNADERSNLRCDFSAGTTLQQVNRPKWTPLRDVTDISSMLYVGIKATCIAGKCGISSAQPQSSTVAIESTTTTIPCVSQAHDLSPATQHANSL